MRSRYERALIFLKMEVGFLIRIYKSTFGNRNIPKLTEARASLNSYILSEVCDFLGARFGENGEYNTSEVWHICIEEIHNGATEAHYTLSFGNCDIGDCDDVYYTQPLVINFVKYDSAAPNAITCLAGCFKIYAHGNFGIQPLLMRKRIACIYQQGLKKYFPECFFAVDEKVYR